MMNSGPVNGGKGDFVCQRCGCPCYADGAGHLAQGSSGMKPCKTAPDVIDRFTYEREIASLVAQAAADREDDIWATTRSGI